MNKNWVSACCVFVGLLGINLQADTIWTGASDLNFGDAANWDNGSPGNTNTVAVINNRDTVSLTSDYSGGSSYTLLVSSNSTLNASAVFTADKLNIHSGSTVNLLSGSAFTMPKTSAGNNSGYSINGTLEIRGGSHVFNERLFGGGTIRVIGDEASVNFHQIVNALKYEFDFDSTGVSGIIGAGSSGAGPYMVLNGATLSVDGSAFSGTGAFTLFRGASATSFFDTSDVTVTGLGAENVGWELNQFTDGGGDKIVSLNVIPEPSAVGLLAFGAAIILTLRRRV